MISGMSPEELADMEQARSNLEHYRNLYELYEYCEALNNNMETLQTRMASVQPANVFNMYRYSSAQDPNSVFAEAEMCL